MCVSTDYTYTYVHICWHRFSSCFVARRELDGAISRQENPNVSFFPGSSSDSEDSVRALQVFGPFGVHSEGKKTTGSRTEWWNAWWAHVDPFYPTIRSATKCNKWIFQSHGFRCDPSTFKPYMNPPSWSLKKLWRFAVPTVISWLIPIF